MFNILIKKTNRNLLIFNIVLFVVWCVLVYLITPFAYNAICGPFEITDEEILAFAEQANETEYPEWDKYNNNYDIVKIPNNFLSMPYLKRGNQFFFKYRVKEPVILRGTELEYNRFEQYPFVKVADKWMYIYRHENLNLKNEMIFTAVNPEFLKGFNSRTYMYSPELKKHFGEENPLADYNNMATVMAHDIGEIFVGRVWLCIIGLLAYLILLGICIYKYIQRVKDIKKHPVFKRNVDFEKLQKELDEHYDKNKNVYTTENFIIEQKIFNLYVSKVIKLRD